VEGLPLPLPLPLPLALALALALAMFDGLSASGFSSGLAIERGRWSDGTGTHSPD
jgi:hypothetical protein